MATEKNPAGEAMRVDRFLWFARLAKTRAVAQAIATRGTLRIDGRRIDRAHATVRVGSVLAWPWNGGVRIVRIDGLPDRRGPAPEAATLYTAIETPASNPVDASGRAQ